MFQGVGNQVKSITDAQIKTLQRLVDVTNDQDPEKPDLLFRMAELYGEQEHYYNFRAREIDQKVFDAQQKGQTGMVSQLKSQQADYEKKEKQWLLSAVKAYKLVADNPVYEKYKNMDQVLFYLAYLLTQQKRDDLARPFFKRLIKDFPKSQFIPYAFLSFGEYYFEQKQLEDALKFYDKVLQFPDSPVFGFAKYKEGWVYFNLGDFKQALATFVAVIELAERGKSKEKLALGKEAKKDSVRAYARVGTPDKAWPFFQRIGGTYAMTMLEQLGELYNSQGQFADAIKVYRQLMSIAPERFQGLHLAERDAQERALDDRRQGFARGGQGAAASRRHLRQGQGRQEAQGRAARRVQGQHRQHAARARHRVAQGSAEDQRQQHL